MVRYMRWAYTGWLGLIVAAIVLQLYLAGYGVFGFNGLNTTPPGDPNGPVRGFEAHFVVGDLIGIAIIIGVALAFAARVPWRITGINVGLVALMIIQFLLAHTPIQAVGALHVVNGIFIFMATAYLTWEVAHLPMPEQKVAAAAPEPAMTR